MKSSRLSMIAAGLALVLAAGLLSGAVAFAAGRSLTIKGSDTMVQLNQAWAEAFMKSHSGTSISVQGGGSGTGIAALINGSTDVCAASRTINPKEISQARDRNVYPHCTSVALDGLSIAVNTSNPISSITFAQIKGIYTGKIRNWKQIGGHDANIVVLSRENTSGTYAYLQEKVLDNERYVATALMMASTKAIQSEISNNANAIGYGGEAYFKGKRNVKIIPVVGPKGGQPIMPSDDTVRSGKYPIARNLYFYTPGSPKGLTKEFVDFCRSSEGQRLVEQVGFTSLKK